MKRKKPHLYFALGHWWVTVGRQAYGIRPENLRRAMFGEAL
jgi:hypothetical protein